MRSLSPHSNLLGILATLSNVGAQIAGLSCIGGYALMLHTGAATEPLTASKLFTILTIVELLSSPINTVGQMLPSFMASYASLVRLQGFLILEEKPTELAPLTVVDVAEEKGAEDEKRDCRRVSNEVSVESASFGWDKETKVLEDLFFRLTPGELHMVRPTFTSYTRTSYTRAEIIDCHPHLRSLDPSLQVRRLCCRHS